MANTTSNTTAKTNDPAKTYTLDDFIAMQSQDELTYANFALLIHEYNMDIAECTLLDYYLDELKTLSLKITSFTDEQIRKYKYAPDLLAYDTYGSTQLDFIVMLCNGIIDPKEFDFKQSYLLLPKSSILKEFLSEIYNAESDWMSINRSALKAAKNS